MTLKNKRDALKKVALFCLMFWFLMLLVEPTFAQGGLEQKAVNFADGFMKVLRAVAFALAGGAITYAGYKFFFKNGSKEHCGQIVGGAFLVGAGPDIGRSLINLAGAIT